MIWYSLCYLIYCNHSLLMTVIMLPIWQRPVMLWYNDAIDDIGYLRFSRHLGFFCYWDMFSFQYTSREG